MVQDRSMSDDWGCMYNGGSVDDWSRMMDNGSSMSISHDWGNWCNSSNVGDWLVLVFDFGHSGSWIRSYIVIGRWQHDSSRADGKGSGEDDLKKKSRVKLSASINNASKSFYNNYLNDILHETSKSLLPSVIKTYSFKRN